jgi:hypothetical protein
MKTQPNTPTPEKSSAAVTDAVADFITSVSKATVSNAEHIVRLADAFITNAEQFLTITKLNCTILRQISILCGFNTILLIWIVIHPLMQKPSLPDSSQDAAIALRHVDEYRQQIEPNSAP